MNKQHIRNAKKLVDGLFKIGDTCEPKIGPVRRIAFMHGSINRETMGCGMNRDALIYFIARHFEAEEAGHEKRAG